jgi:hypothetical protein
MEAIFLCQRSTFRQLCSFGNFMSLRWDHTPVQRVLRNVEICSKAARTICTHSALQCYVAVLVVLVYLYATVSFYKVRCFLRLLFSAMLRRVVSLIYRCFNHPDDGQSKRMRNVGQLLRDYTAQRHKRQSFS